MFFPLSILTFEYPKMHMICLFYTRRKWVDFQLIFRITMTICNSFPIHYNSTYFYGCDCYRTSYMNCSGYNSLMWNYIDMQFMQFNYNYCVILMQLIFNYHSNALLTSFFINPSKFDHDIMEILGWIFFSFWNIDHHPLWLFIYNGF